MWSPDVQTHVLRSWWSGGSMSRTVNKTLSRWEHQHVRVMEVEMILWVWREHPAFTLQLRKVLHHDVPGLDIPNTFQTIKFFLQDALHHYHPVTPFDLP